ncbi:MAG TPA: glycosyltransferase [Leptospiraceae bacterium]|nr:glycosyltransferase [Leptospiraceae bacterium]
MYSISASFQPGNPASELFLRTAGNVQFKDGKIQMEKDSSVFLSTYFSSFSAFKWAKYTSLRKIYLQLNCEGSCILRLFSENAEGKKLISEKEHSGTGRTDIILEDTYSQPEIIYAELQSKDKVLFEGGFWGTDEIPEQSVNTAFIICTFRREEYVQRNLRNIFDNLKQTETAPFSVYVSDNGKTLPETDSENLKIFHNSNSGGAGGFTRGIIEAMKDSSISRLCLMDDDADFHFSALERLLSFQSFLKKEYRSTFIAGAMLEEENPSVQFEAAAEYTKSGVRSIGNGIELHSIKGILMNEIPVEKENVYCGWWLCCFPKEAVLKKGLPLPFFIKGDDHEFSLRNNVMPLSLNGFSVWHKSFKNKHKSWIYYYWYRNALIMNNYVLKNYGRSDYLKFILIRVFHKFLTLKFEEIRYIHLALEDYRKGPSFLKETDQEKYHSMLGALPLKWQKISAVKRLGSVFRIFLSVFSIFTDFEKLKLEYMQDYEYLRSKTFWMKFLNLK